MRNAPEGIIGTKPDPFAGLPLAIQREASPEVARPVPRVVVTGASQEAREAIAPHLNALQARVLQGIVAWEPCTRDLLADQLGMNPNTLRPRVKELLAMGRVYVHSYTPSPRRELLAATPPTEGTDR